MIEFLTTYAPDIIQTLIMVAPLTYAVVLRIVNDKTIIAKFEDFKDLAGQVNRKEIDISGVLTNVVSLVGTLKGEIDDIKLEFAEEVKKIDETILEFTQSEIYTKMLLGLTQVDELIKLLENKDATIEQLGNVIKDIKKKLGWFRWLMDLDMKNYQKHIKNGS